MICDTKDAWSRLVSAWRFNRLEESHCRKAQSIHILEAAWNLEQEVAVSRRSKSALGSLSRSLARPAYVNTRSIRCDTPMVILEFPCVLLKFIVALCFACFDTDDALAAAMLTLSLVCKAFES